MRVEPLGLEPFRLNLREWCRCDTNKCGFSTGQFCHACHGACRVLNENVAVFVDAEGATLELRHSATQLTSMNVRTCLVNSNSAIIQCNAQRCHNMHKSGAYRSVSMRITAWLNLLVLIGTCSCVAARDVRNIAQKLQHRIDAQSSQSNLTSMADLRFCFNRGIRSYAMPAATQQTWLCRLPCNAHHPGNSASDKLKHLSDAHWY